MQASARQMPADVNSIDLALLTASEGVVIRGGYNENSLVGQGVSAAGDVNGDGFDDVIVGAINDDYESGGQAYVIFGTNSGFASPDANGQQVLDVTTLDQSQGFVIQGDPTDGVGRSVSSAGDVNGDGFDDLIIGAPEAGYDGSNSFSGKAYVVFGTDAGFGTDVNGRQVLDLTSLDSSEGFVISGDTPDSAGGSVSGAGDVNDDGFDDVIVGARLGNDGGTQAGQAYVVFGSADPSDINGDTGGVQDDPEGAILLRRKFR